ncbi:MAG: DMT family transporter [Gemmatimonadota bacterium]|nr:DMT family transporter [Gemmatimonadota bacterium]MDP6802220.1 DMT family transporter [Gemmatimonadota bacterium]MDP7032141.1 DMT family transporter [Gemmatimonadota bacterium]
MPPTAALLLVSFLWGATFVAVKASLDHASPLLFVGMRFALATLATLPLLRHRGPEVRAALVRGIGLGVVLAGGYCTQTLGLAVTTPARSAFITGLSVALVPVWSMLLTGRKPRPLSMAGLALAVPGLWILTAPEAGSWNRGDSWTIACAFFFGLHVALLGKYGRDYDRAGLLVSQLGVTAALALLLSPLVETPRMEPVPVLLTGLATTAILATACVVWLQLRYQPKVEPTRAALVYATEPLFAAGFSWVLLGETLTPTAWLGGIIILGGMVLSEAGALSPSSRTVPPRSAGPPSRSPPA